MAKGFKTGGRPPGTPNKATIEFRQTVQALLDDNRENVGAWLTLVALGIDPNPETGFKGVPADPGKALDLMAKLAEYAAPKLARTEVTGPDGGPLQTQQVEMLIVDPQG